MKGRLEKKVEERTALATPSVRFNGIDLTALGTVEFFQSSVPFSPGDEDHETVEKCADKEHGFQDFSLSTMEMVRILRLESEEGLRIKYPMMTKILPQPVAA